LFPKNNAFKNKRLVPYQAPLKFGLSANIIARPLPIGLTIKDADGFKNILRLSLEIYPSICGFLVYFATVELHVFTW